MKGGKVVCTTRWRLVISDYNSIRACLLNTTALEDTNLILYHINETTLITWYKNDMWRDEIRMLLQGLPSSQHQLVAEDDLPPAKELPSAPATPPVKPHTFNEAEDTSGQAVVRKKTKSSSRPLASSGPPSKTKTTPDLIAAADLTLNPILKIDSTKKICKKLQGMDANTASWTTNVGNKRGDIDVSADIIWICGSSTANGRWTDETLWGAPSTTNTGPLHRPRLLYQRRSV